jgi:hypothetical protein
VEGSKRTSSSTSTSELSWRKRLLSESGQSQSFLLCTSIVSCLGYSLGWPLSFCNPPKHRNSPKCNSSRTTSWDKIDVNYRLTLPSQFPCMSACPLSMIVALGWQPLRQQLIDLFSRTTLARPDSYTASHFLAAGSHSAFFIRPAYTRARGSS